MVGFKAQASLKDKPSDLGVQTTDVARRGIGKVWLSKGYWVDNPTNTSHHPLLLAKTDGNSSSNTFKRLQVVLFLA